MKPNQPNRYIAALYMRLSKEDIEKEGKQNPSATDADKESASITTQRKMLTAYAKENGFIIYDEYIDDGISGTTFDRPNFKRMIQDIEDKKVNMVITKDLSRLGRDYITSGQYTEIYFPSKGVRYIAINDGYDSDSPYTDIAPFKNIINEMYARDTSKKIRSSFIAKMNDGDFIGNFAPYGYQKDSQNKNHLVIDPESSVYVREIFQMASAGSKPKDIVRLFNEKQIVPPMVYRCQKYNLDVDKFSKHKEWTTSSVSKILHNIVYLGHMAQRKTTKVSFKCKTTIRNSKKDWIVVEHTHEPLVDAETFELVQRLSESRTTKRTKGFVNIFSGIAKCPDCGRNMSSTGTRKKGSPANLVCGQYKLYGSSKCSNHNIDYNVLYSIVLESIQEQMKLLGDKDALIHELNNELKDDSQAKEKEQLLHTLHKKAEQLDGLIEKLYEDNFNRVISNERFQKLLAKYENESQTIHDRISSLKKERESANAQISQQESFDKFLRILEEFEQISELTPDLLFKLIDRIEVYQGHYEQTKQGKVKHQTVKIYYRFIGKETRKEYCV